MAVRHDDPVGGAANGNGDRFARRNPNEARGVRLGRIAYPERQAVEHLVADRRPSPAAEGVQSRVAQPSQVKRFVIGQFIPLLLAEAHGSTTRLSSLSLVAVPDKSGLLMSSNEFR
jgi:hypothetical protein